MMTTAQHACHQSQPPTGLALVVPGVSHAPTTQRRTLDRNRRARRRDRAGHRARRGHAHRGGMSAARLCLEPGCTDIGNPRCPDHTRARRPPPRVRRLANAKRDARRGTTASRGYGADHQRAARRLKAELVDGDPCCRCGQPMYRQQLEVGRLDLQGIDADHHDTNARDDEPPDALSHRLCNRRAGGLKGRGPGRS